MHMRDATPILVGFVLLVVISRHTGECVNIYLQKLMLYLIILTFKHEKSSWLL
jgi:hypothetical protein